MHLSRFVLHVIYFICFKVQHCTMPGLTVALTLNKLDQSEEESQNEAANDLVGFISGLLLGNNSDVKNWFSQFIKCGQRVIR